MGWEGDGCQSDYDEGSEAFVIDHAIHLGS